MRGKAQARRRIRCPKLSVSRYSPMRSALGALVFLVVVVKTASTRSLIELSRLPVTLGRCDCDDRVGDV